MTTTYKRSAGFTLMELLIVMAIIAVLFALLLPIVMRGYRQYLSREAAVTINLMQGYLEDFLVEHRRYPTNEEGLFALVYVPNIVGVNPMIQQPGSMPGVGDPTLDPSLTGGMMNQSGSAGAELLQNTNPMGAPMPSGFPGQPGGLPGQTGLMGGSGTDPTTGQPMPGGVGGSMSTTDLMGGVGGVGGAMTSTWTQPFHNPQLYGQQPRQRSTPYMNARNLTDPWGQPYRYDASMTWYGVNQYTGESRPAIWSAGPDKQDGTDDDIRNWKPEETQGLLLQRQQQMQMQQQGGQGQFGGSQSIGSDSLMNDPNNMMMPGGGMQMPMQPGGGQMPTLPGGGQMPMVPGGGQMPMVPGGGQMPTLPGGGQMPTVPGGGQMPMVPGGGQMPTVPGGGQMPMVPGGGQMLPQPGL